MPPVAQPASSSHARNIQPTNPNLAKDASAHTAVGGITHKPAPAIVNTSSHVGAHVLPRRFLGPMPEHVANSDEVQEWRRRFKALRNRALRRIRGEDDVGSGGSELFHDDGSPRGVSGTVRKIRVRRRGKNGEDIMEDVDLESDREDSLDEDVGEERHYLRRATKKKKKKRKDVWVGESFDIGREFFSAPKSTKDDTSAPDGFVDQPISDTAIAPKRPTNSSRSTVETFVTARTAMSGSAGPSKSTLSLDTENSVENGYPLGDEPPPSTNGNSSLAPPPLQIRSSQSSSLQPLIGDKFEDGIEGSAKSPKGRRLVQDRATSMSTPTGLRRRLKSAIRKTPPLPNRAASSSVKSALNGSETPKYLNGRTKTVHFPIAQPHHQLSRATLGDGERPRRGNKNPVDPDAVLAREGDDAAGTSSGAADKAMNHETDDDVVDDVSPGEVIMRGE